MKNSKDKKRTIDVPYRLFVRLLVALKSDLDFESDIEFAI